LLGLGLLIGAGVVLLFPPLRARLLGSQSLANRLSLYAQAGLLLRDAPFTGVGLGEFPLVHSTYALLIHVPILPHAHSLFLDIALGQGLGGLLAAVAVLGGAAWLGLRALARAGSSRPALVAGLLSLAVMVLHGLGDDPLYGSRGVAFFWAPAGLVIAGWRSFAGDSPPVRWPAARTWRAAGIAAVAGLALIALFWRPLAAAWYADLGAVHQMRTELGAYDPNRFDDPTLEQIRAQADLSAAEAYFERALALEPGCATARTRLALIALGRGQDAQALAHARAAWEAGHHDRVTRLVLGDALVAAGEIEAAVETVRGLEWAEARLEGQAWSRYWVSGDYRRAAGAWRAVVLLNPWNARAADAMALAKERAENQ
jgi:tetratricopeptide (TPR) repeat protein